MEEGSAAGDDGVLVPVVLFDEFAEGGAVGDVSHEAAWSHAEAFDDLAAEGHDAHGGVFGIELAGVFGGGVAAGPEVRLRAGHHPVEVYGPDTGDDVGGNGGEPGDAGLGAVLDAAAAGAFDFDFTFESEVFGGDVAVGDVGVTAGILRGGFADDDAIFNAPEFGIAVPAFEGLAVEEGDVAGVIVEVEGLGFAEAAGGEDTAAVNESGDLVGGEGVGGGLDLGEGVGAGVGEGEFGGGEGVGVSRDGDIISWIGEAGGDEFCAGGGKGLGG